MPVIRFNITSTLAASELMAILTDFGPSRPQLWPTIDAAHFHVHSIGDTWAEVTEGTASAWERARYDWDADRRRVTITTHDSKVFGPGGGWTFQLTPLADGTRVDIELIRTPTGFWRRILAALLPLVAPATLKKSFAGPLHARPSHRLSRG
jgi:YD repeat-containing protein